MVCTKKLLQSVLVNIIDYIGLIIQPIDMMVRRYNYQHHHQQQTKTASD